MEIGDRARRLIAQGADPRAAADQSVPSRYYKKMAARDLRFRAAILVGGAAVTAIGGWVTGYQRLTPAQTVQQHQLAEAGVGPDDVLPVDIRARLALPPQDIALVAALLRIEPRVEPDMSWQAVLQDHPSLAVALPSREGALRSIIDTLAPLSPDERRNMLMTFRVEVGLTSTARGLVQALHDVPPSELSQLLPLLISIMRLPAQQRAALERAGFPAVPADTDRQDLYKRLGWLSADQVAFLDQFLKEPERWDALLRVHHLLQARTARRILGAVADGTLSFTDNPGLPAGCDIGTAASCKIRR